MKEFAKLFEVGQNQVLIEKVYNDEDDVFELELITMESGMRMSIQVPFKSEEDRDAEFNEYDQLKAAKFINTIHEIIAKSIS